MNVCMMLKRTNGEMFVIDLFNTRSPIRTSTIHVQVRRFQDRSFQHVQDSILATRLSYDRENG